ncbi:hypothetical protein [Nonomuraea basaltis]|uniref:hypothetical protein n=1 Tax=Nonomuraea basaltis TaxID=2495887 RepID=UPI00110C5654|nr:hypothetical protein [Nonomuraea basaltis]TMR93764.1 hypothetical protein EJK15_37340 [Nonomuraea basaltis]
MLVPVLASDPADLTDSSGWSADSDDKSVAGGVDDLGASFSVIIDHWSRITGRNLKAVPVSVAAPLTRAPASQMKIFGRVGFMHVHVR